MSVAMGTRAGWRLALAVLVCCTACGSGALAEELSVLIGQVNDGELRVLGPDAYLPSAYRLTSIRMQEARSPESGELDLRAYEGAVLVVEGRDAGGWLYSASILEVAPPLLAQYVLASSRPGKLCEFDVVLPLIGSREYAMDLLTEKLEGADESLDVLTSLPDPWVTDRLIEAASRGTTVRLLVAKCHADRADVWDRLLSAGVQVRVSEEQAPAFLIIDNETVVLGRGSLAEEDWTAQPPILCMECPILTAAPTPVEQYAREFMTRWGEGLPLPPGG